MIEAKEQVLNFLYPKRLSHFSLLIIYYLIKQKCVFKDNSNQIGIYQDVASEKIIIRYNNKLNIEQIITYIIICLFRYNIKQYQFILTNYLLFNQNFIANEYKNFYSTSYDISFNKDLIINVPYHIQIPVEECMLCYLGGEHYSIRTFKYYVKYNAYYNINLDIKLLRNKLYTKQDVILLLYLLKLYDNNYDLLNEYLKQILIQVKNFNVGFLLSKLVSVNKLNLLTILLQYSNINYKHIRLLINLDLIDYIKFVDKNIITNSLKYLSFNEIVKISSIIN